MRFDIILTLSCARLSELSWRTFRPAFLFVALITCGLSIARPAAAHAADCNDGSSVTAAANGASYATLAWSPFGRAETGWQVYYPRIAAETGTRCAPEAPGFAAAIATWQRAHGLRGTGVFEPATFAAMKSTWQGARPFVHAHHVCPLPPSTAALTAADRHESFGGKTILMRVRALAAYRAMVLAARSADGAIRHHARAFQIFSGYRDPDADAARCAAQGNCQGIVRAACSAHRTGLAMDIWVGQAPGYSPDSSADVSRLAMVATPEYRWLLVNARRFGFVNYAFEPWHWEWIGEPI